MILSTVVFVPIDFKVGANPGGEGGIELDTQFIFNITQNLSNIIFQAYNTSELQKGREFGSKGEHAADYLISLLTNI